MTSFVDYFKTTILANVLLSALGMNYVFELENDAVNTYNAYQKALFIFKNDIYDRLVCGGIHFLMTTGLK